MASGALRLGIGALSKDCFLALKMDAPTTTTTISICNAPSQKNDQGATKDKNLPPDQLLDQQVTPHFFVFNMPKIALGTNPTLLQVRYCGINFLVTSERPHPRILCLICYCFQENA
jgi:hypothetical protein